MKYMGSKRAMLQNGLGQLLEGEMGTARRFVDLFTGSGVVAIHVACRFSLPVLAFDLQQYSVILTRAVVSRQNRFPWEDSWNAWYGRAEAHVNALNVPVLSRLTKGIVANFREWCAKQTEAPITKAYGGHYFSPRQAAWIDALRATLPKRDPAKTAALAALIQAASHCAASPGHTAQPFQPTRTANLFLRQAWEKNIVERTKHSFISIARLFAKENGTAEVMDANKAAAQLKEGDLAFIDPPYSGVHYSRFYHVLETVARGDCGEVSGAGRYPAADLRPRSSYSLKTTSAAALNQLLQTIATRGARAILTFPAYKCSNGLSGDSVYESCCRHFRVIELTVKSRFSTLGGTGNDCNEKAGRAARRYANELMLVLEPI